LIVFVLFDAFAFYRDAASQLLINFCAVDFHGAAKACESEFLSARSTGVWGLPGEPVLPKGADEQRAWPASLSPGKK